MMLCKSRVTCGGRMHAIRLTDDSNGPSPLATLYGPCRVELMHDECAHSGAEQLTKLAAAARLGAVPEAGGCLGIALLVEYGLPAIFTTGSLGETLNLGFWRALYIRYETNTVVQVALARLRIAAEAEHTEVLQKARESMLKVGRSYQRVRNDIVAETTFVPNAQALAGANVASFRTDIWTVPLQKGWVASVYDCGMAVVDDRFVVGVVEDKPGFVYAITREDDVGRFVVREFFYNHHLRRLGRVKESTL